MPSQLSAFCFYASQPDRLARFWSDFLAGETDENDIGFRLRFLPTDEPKTVQNQMHFDFTSKSLEDQARTVARALELGARHIDVGQRPEEGHVVLADPEGNEFDIIEPGNNFLADCGFLGALACDGSQAVGYFWSAALGWPLVWDQDQETAIRSPRGGPKVSWGGPPVNPKTGRNRVRFDLAADGDRQAEVDRLLVLGATLIGGGELADPDGNEFSLLPS